MKRAVGHLLGLFALVALLLVTVPSAATAQLSGSVTSTSTTPATTYGVAFKQSPTTSVVSWRAGAGAGHQDRATGSSSRLTTDFVAAETADGAAITGCGGAATNQHGVPSGDLSPYGVARLDEVYQCDNTGVCVLGALSTGVVGGGAMSATASLRAGLAAARAAEVGGAVLNFGSKAAAREGLTGDAGTAANRFFRGATSKSQDFQAQELSGGGYRLQFFSPANNPGYGKLYVQEIDSAGNVLREFKNTMGADGLIETKWVHGGP